jgi:hypothetical protein
MIEVGLEPTPWDQSQRANHCSILTDNKSFKNRY